jgi:hypothetical protein
MRTILATEDADEFEMVWDRLTEGGIPVFTPSKYSEMSGFHVGARQYVLCIWLDHQFEDAVQLLRNPDHVVQNPVDLDEFERMQDQVDERMEKKTDLMTEKALNWGVGLLVLAICGGFAYFATR